MDILALSGHSVKIVIQVNSDARYIFYGFIVPIDIFVWFLFFKGSSTLYAQSLKICDFYFGLICTFKPAKVITTD